MRWQSHTFPAIARSTLWCALFFTIGMSGAAIAHGIDIFATVEGENIQGKLQYADHTPIPGVAVTAYAPDGAVIAETTTNEEGRFKFPISRHCDYKIVGDAGDGHTGTYTLAASELPDHPHSGNESHSPVATTHTGVDLDQLDARIEQVIARQLSPLREQLNEHDQAIRLRDLLGGVGYVFGLAGIVVLLKHRKPSES